MKILKWIVILIVAVPVVLLAGTFIRNKAIGPVGWAEDNTIKKLKAQMKDPESTVIRTSFVVQRQEPGTNNITITICGVVDGKNTFGAYTGGSRFVSRSVQAKDINTFDTYEVIIEDPEQKGTAQSVNRLSGFESVYWNSSCVDAAHPALQPASS